MKDRRFYYQHREPAKWRQVVTEYPCPVCGAGPGEDCTTTSGRISYTPHADRSRLASANHWQEPSL